jgi:hypothetical protein
MSEEAPTLDVDEQGSGGVVQVVTGESPRAGTQVGSQYLFQAGLHRYGAHLAALADDLSPCRFTTRPANGME